MSAKCRHYGAWLMADGHIEWCYHCGAVRTLRVISPCASVPAITWVRPTGPGGKNPYEKVRELKPPAWVEMESES